MAEILPASPVRLGDVGYEAEDRPHACLYRVVEGDGTLQALAVKGRPGFRADEALAGVAYRVEWLTLAEPAWDREARNRAARAAGAAIFAGHDHAVATGDCLHFICPDGGSDRLGQLWCYHPRAWDGGTLSLLHEWREARESRGRRRLRLAA
jgi:uncharacterized protein